MTKLEIFETKTAALAEQFPDWGQPMIAFSGRSNVGKSSLLNALTGLKGKDAARVSNTPGRTRQIHFYRAEGITLVDLPGYGFARAGGGERKRWQKLIGDFLASDPGPELLIALVDIRHETKKLDVQLVEYARELNVEVLIVATKADKLSGNDLQKNLAELKKGHGLKKAPVAVSSTKGTNLPLVMKEIRARKT